MRARRLARAIVEDASRGLYKLLLGHLHPGVLGLLQLGSLLSRAFLTPTHLHPFDSTHTSAPIIGSINRGPLLLGHPIFFLIRTVFQYWWWWLMDHLLLGGEEKEFTFM